MSCVVLFTKQLHSKLQYGGQERKYSGISTFRALVGLEESYLFQATVSPRAYSPQERCLHLQKLNNLPLPSTPSVPSSVLILSIPPSGCGGSMLCREVRSSLTYCKHMQLTFHKTCIVFHTSKTVRRGCLVKITAACNCRESSGSTLDPHLNSR